MVTLQETFNQFIASRILKDCSHKTIYSYNCFIKPFLSYMEPDIDFCSITQSDIDNYILSILMRDISKHTKATYIRHFKTFLKWCSEEYDVKYNYSKVKVPKTYKRVRKIYNLNEMQMIFDSIVAESEWITLRNKCLVALMYDSGLRRSELLSVKLSKLSFDEKVLTVCGKGNKERTVPLGSVSTKFLKKYLQICPFKSDIVFLNRHGLPMTDNAVKLLIHKIAKKVPFEFSCHKLRHNFATNYCIDQYEKYGHMDIYKLMYLMGHEDVETTRVYLHFANSMIASKENISHLDKLALKYN